jgi:hypothetical protein
LCLYAKPYMNMHGEWQFHYVSAIDDNTIKGLSLYAGEFLLVEILCIENVSVLVLKVVIPWLVTCIY